LASQLIKEFPSKRISARYADTSDYESLVAAFKDVSMVIVASTTTQNVKQVAQAAIDARIDYLDYHYQQITVPILNAMAPSIKGAGRCFITQAGFHPGLPSVFVRYAAPNFDRYKKAVISTAMNTRIEKPESVYEIVDEIGEWKADIFKDGKWKRAGYKDANKVDFGPPFGIRSCYPLQMEEICPLPEMFGLNEVGVYVAGFNWFVDFIVFPLGFILFKIRKGFGRHFIAGLMVRGINSLSSSQQGVSFVLEAEGEKEGKTVKVRLKAEYNDAYYFTAIPVVACIIQYLDGSIAKPGLWMMGHVVDPVRLMNDMERMGIKIQMEVTQGNRKSLN
jgi:saccharopine dehydrogenase-like NADP-dependent oxidoreductase